MPVNIDEDLKGKALLKGFELATDGCNDDDEFGISRSGAITRSAKSDVIAWRVGRF